MSVGPVARNGSTEEFFDGTAAGQFLIRRCSPDGHLSRPQARQCSECGTTELSWTPATGRARLISWVVIPVRSGEGEPPRPPIVAAIGELEEGPWWWSMVVGADPDALAEGQPLRIEYERAGGGEAVPIFVVDTTRRDR
jgi:uncharacterized OB-fold protein